MLLNIIFYIACACLFISATVELHLASKLKNKCKLNPSDKRLLKKYTDVSTEAFFYAFPVGLMGIAYWFNNWYCVALFGFCTIARIQISKYVPRKGK